MSDTVQLETPCIDLPQTKRGHERRIALIESATELFLQHGYEAVSLDDIVHHAGGSKASIYKYFGNKEGLFRAICDYRCACFEQDITLTPKPDAEALRDYLKRILLNFIRHILQPRNISFIRLIINQSQKDPQLADYLHRNGAANIQKTITQALEQDHARGLIHCPAPSSSAIMYLGIIRDYEWRVILGVNIAITDQEVDNHIQYCIDRFLAGHQRHEFL